MRFKTIGILQLCSLASLLFGLLLLIPSFFLPVLVGFSAVMFVAGTVISIIAGVYLLLNFWKVGTNKDRIAFRYVVYGWVLYFVLSIISLLLSVIASLVWGSDAVLVNVLMILIQIILVVPIALSTFYLYRALFSLGKEMDDTVLRVTGIFSLIMMIFIILGGIIFYPLQYVVFAQDAPYADISHIAQTQDFVVIASFLGIVVYFAAFSLASLLFGIFFLLTLFRLDKYVQS